MNSPKNDDKTGKVTIERKGKHCMAASVWRTFFCWFLLLGVVATFLSVLVTSISIGDSESEMTVDFCVGLIFSLVVGSCLSFGNMGTRVESICFDYDARQVVIAQGTLLNKKQQVTIPFHQFHFKHKETRNSRLFLEDRVILYDLNDKVAVVAYGMFGWNAKKMKLLDQELEGFLIKEGN